MLRAYLQFTSRENIPVTFSSVEAIFRWPSTVEYIIYWYILYISFIYSIELDKNLRAMAKNGSSRCFLAKNGCTLKTIAAESVVGRIWLAKTHYLPFLAKSDRVLPVIATLLSFHPFLAIFCSVFGHFMFLSGGLLDYSNRSTGAKVSPRWRRGWQNILIFL